MIVDILFQKGFMRINRVDNIYKVNLNLKNNNNQNKKQDNKEENNNSFEEQFEKEKTLKKEIRRKF